MPEPPRRRTPALGVPIGDEAPRDTSETIRLMHRTARDTEQVARDARQAATTTLDRVAELRQELNVDIGRVELRVETLAAHVGDLRETTANVVGKLDVLVDEIKADRAERGTIRVTAAAAH